MKHKSINVVINGKTCEIDVDIEPLVKWFNSHKNVITTYCCQGDGNVDSVGSLLPYVSFMSKNRFKRLLYREIVSFLKANKNCGYLQFIERDHLFYGSLVERNNGSSLSFANKNVMLSFFNFVKSKNLT